MPRGLDAMRREAQLRGLAVPAVPQPEHYSSWQAFEDVWADYHAQFANLLKEPVLKPEGRRSRYEVLLEDWLISP